MFGDSSGLYRSPRIQSIFILFLFRLTKLCVESFVRVSYVISPSNEIILTFEGCQIFDSLERFLRDYAFVFLYFISVSLCLCACASPNILTSNFIFVFFFFSFISLCLCVFRKSMANVINFASTLKVRVSSMASQKC